MKSENSQLRRQVARLQREIDRLQFVGNVEGEEEVIELRPVKHKQLSCQACGKGKLKEMTTPGGKKIITCVECLHRQTT
jgi:hypothetical protein